MEKCEAARTTPATEPSPLSEPAPCLPGKPPGFLAGIASCGAFLAAFVLGCMLLRSGQPFKAAPGLVSKYNYFATHRDDYEVLFIGSSRIYHQIIPKQFDARVAEREGIKLRSFNCGYDGCWPPESYFLLRKLLALRPRKLRWVVVDLMEIDARIDERSKTLRMAYWHDWTHTMMAWRQLVRPPATLLDAKTSAMAVEHGKYLLKQWTGFGRGAEWMEDRLTSKKKKKPPLEPKEWAGKEGFNAGLTTAMAGRELADFEEKVASLPRQLSPKSLSPAFSDAVRKLIVDIRKAGAEPVFLIAPTLNPYENFARLPDGEPLLAFNDPRRYPRLFDPAMHYDGWHLNEKGAIYFTDLVAEQFCEVLRKDSRSLSR